ncbi:uncharacterized protein ISCGN_002997 [Ixodes scapularis]
MKTRPIITYQCYHSTITNDPPGSANFTILWDWTNKQTPEAHGITWSAKTKTPNSYTRDTIRTHYDAVSGVGKINTTTVQEELTVLLPFEGKVLYEKIVLTSENNTLVNKIYDVDFECENAKKLLKKICPQPCNMILSRDLNTD